MQFDLGPRWVKQTSDKIIERWATVEAPAGSQSRLSFDPTSAQVNAWLQHHASTLDSTETDVDAGGVDDGEAGSILTELSRAQSLSDSERVEVETHLFNHGSESDDGSPSLATHPKCPAQLLGSPRLRGTIRSLPLPLSPRRVFSITRRARSAQDSNSDHVPSTNSATSRSHATARKYLCAFLHAHGKLRCTVSSLKQHLQYAHLISLQTTFLTRQRLEYAIGGRFCRNSRIQYLILKADFHGDLDSLNRVLVYPTEPHVLAALEDYLCWLDVEDGGHPSSQQNLVDYMPALRAQHPTMADGHEYRIRYIAITSRQVFDPFYRASIIRCVPPFINLPLGSTFANPIFVALNALEHMLHNFGALDWTAWNTWRTQAQWVSWITSEAKLAHLQQMQVEGTEGSVVEEFAAFLTVAAHLRRRLGVDFTWKTVGKSSQPSGPSVGGGGTREADGAGGAGGSGGDPAPRGGSGWATKILGESQDPNIAPTPSTAIAAAWRAKNIGSEPPTGTPRRSFWGAIVGRLNKARPAGKEVSGSRGGMVMYS